MSASQRWAGCIAGFAIGLTTVGTATAQAPQGLAPDPSPVPATQHPVPDAAPGAAVKAVPRSAPAAPRVQAAPARPAVQAVPAAATGATRPRSHHRTAGVGGGAGAARPRRAAPSPAPHLRLGALRRALAGLKPVSARARASRGSRRLVFTLAGGTLLVLAAAGTATLTRTTAKARA